MQKIRAIRFILLIFSVIFIVSCSEYEKVLKSPDFEWKYRKAMEYYQKKDYSRAITVFEQIVSYYRASVKGDSVMYFLGHSYYGQEDFIMAGYYFKELSDNYVSSPFVEECDYLNGYCYYLSSPRPTLDQENTRLGILAFKKFIYKHPESKYVPECKRLIAELNNKLSEKAYINAKLYYNLGYYKAAIVAIKNCLEEYPDTKYREELMFMTLESSFEYAQNSIVQKQKERFQLALDDYYSFVGEYAQSKYSKSAEKMYIRSKEVLGL